MLLFNLYQQNESFRVDDEISILKDHDNVTLGATGTVISKHPNSNYYEVEFIDANGNLLNILSVCADDMQHVSQPDLAARVDTFGQTIN